MQIKNALATTEIVNLHNHTFNVFSINFTFLFFLLFYLTFILLYANLHLCETCDNSVEDNELRSFEYAYHFI